MPPPRIRSARRRRLFLAALSETALVAAACRAGGAARGSFYRWRYEDPDFAEDWDRALDIGISTLEDEAIRRARDGVPAPVFHGGVQIATVRRYSDRLLMFLLKAHRPALYREYAGRAAIGPGMNAGALPGYGGPDDILPDGRRLQDLSLDELKRELDGALRDYRESEDRDRGSE